MAGFRYFELIDEEASRFAFWEIAIDGPTLLIRAGAVGTAGKDETETCASEALARNEYEIRIATHTEEGYHECSDRRVDTRTRALEDAIEADPDDASAYMVYADWIQTLGDLRGGLIIAQLAGESDEAAAARADAYLAQHAAVFLGPLSDVNGYDGSALALTWRYGFIHAAKVNVRDVFEVVRAERALEWLLEHPSARWLRSLQIATADDYAGLQQVVDVLAAHRLPHLRSLTIGEIGSRYRDEYGDDVYDRRPTASLGALWAAIPAVTKLVLEGDSGELGVMKLEYLKHLELHGTWMDPRLMRAVVAAECPAIERLELRYRSTLQPELEDQLRPLFESSLVRRLDHLGITGVLGGDRVCTALSRVRRLSMKTLDLRACSITLDGADALAASELELDMLDVSRNPIDHRSLPGLERIAKVVFADR